MLYRHDVPWQARVTRPRITALVSGLAFLPMVPCAAADSATPNIVIIYMDDLGYADIGSFGARAYRTPNLDRLAKEGTKFTSFYSAQAVCSASRAALMTGCYPNRIGITGALMPHSRVGISENEMTLAEVCKQKGYATGAFGKWHLGDAQQFLPLQHGFDEYFGLPYSNDMNKKQQAPLPLLRNNTVVNPDVKDPAQDQLTTWYTEEAVSFINRHQQQPFFLYLPHSMVHVPLHVSAKFRGKSGSGLFGDVMMEVDASVGEIMKAIKDHGLDERTLVVFSSDNGPWLNYGNHAGSAAPLREGKGSSWDGGVRVPTMMRWPGRIPENRVCDAPLMTIDLLPTVARLINAQVPEQKIDGLDISAVITGKTAASPHDVLYFYYGQNNLEALRRGKWKLELPRDFRTLNGRPPGKDGIPVPYSTAKITKPELYDLDADPGQHHDLAALKPEVLQQVLADAERMRADLGDNLTKQQGPGCRQPGRAGDKAVYPSDPAFPKAIDPKYCPGLKAQPTLKPAA